MHHISFAEYHPNTVRRLLEIILFKIPILTSGGCQGYVMTYDSMTTSLWTWGHWKPLNINHQHDES